MFQTAEVLKFRKAQAAIRRVIYHSRLHMHIQSVPNFEISASSDAEVGTVPNITRAQQ